MPIVIAREGPVEPVVTGISPERRQAAWDCIVRAWAEKNQDLLRSAGQTGKENENGNA